MFLSGVLFILFLAGCWLLTRARRRVRRWPQTLASLVTMGNYYSDVGLPQARPMTAEAALARHPASQARRAADPFSPVPIGPDDDPEFLRLLDQRIKGASDSGELGRVLTFSLRECGLAAQAPDHS